MVLEGWNYSKLVIITSSRTEEIADYILHGLDRSGTPCARGPLPQREANSS